MRRWQPQGALRGEQTRSSECVHCINFYMSTNHACERELMQSHCVGAARQLSRGGGGSSIAEKDIHVDQNVGQGERCRGAWRIGVTASPRIVVHSFIDALDSRSIVTFTTARERSGCAER